MESDSVCNHMSGAGVQFVNHKYDYRPTSDDMKSTYQLIISRRTRNKNTFKEIIMLEC